MKRRDVLKLGLLAGAAAAVPAERLTGAFAQRAVAAGPPVQLFDTPLVVPPVLKPKYSIAGTDYYDVTIKPAVQEILPGLRTPIWGYDGIFPGPTIKTRRNRPIVVRQRNKLPGESAVHLHGANVPSSSDGLPGDEIAPGKDRFYLYPNRQQATTLWYHDHVHHHEAFNTYQGLTGLYLITDPAEDKLGLPSGKYDVPLVIQDRSFNADGTFRIPDPGAGEFFGEVAVVNGKPHPFLQVEQRRYRFRLLNGSSLDTLHELTLGSGDGFHVIGTDGGLLPAPVPVTKLPLAPSERAEVVIDFSRYPVGSHVVLNSSIFGAPMQIMRFDVRKATGPNHRLPSKLVPIQRLKESQAKVRRDFQLNLDKARGEMVINGKTFDPDRIDIKPKLGATEVWTIFNAETPDLPIPHVFHTHLVRFQILDRNGVPPAPFESGWKDSVTVMPGEKVRIIMRFGDFPGRFLYHCHLLGHADAGMMATMLVTP
ncbi:multicopper oxidase domain-containing protein [Kribbella sp. NPDC051952]|uniref:multicopper oxidase family protein n=1 Tax=Kribbella sp. NPDC051952 TaxID=3154851 RepID=UPI003440F13E